MPNTKRNNKNPVSDSGTAPAAPIAAAPIAPQVAGVTGGSPTTTPQASMGTALIGLKKAWGMTGTPDAASRTFNRAVLGAEPAMVAQSLNKYWAGASAGKAGVALPTPSSVSYEDAQKYLGDLTKEVKARLDDQLKQMTPDAIAKSRFWRTYQAMPEPMATLAARRHWTNSMVGTGPVADWLAWLKG